MNRAIIKDAQERLHGICLNIMELNLNAGGLHAVEMALAYTLEAQYHLKSLRAEWENAQERIAYLEEAARLAPWSSQIQRELDAARGVA